MTSALVGSAALVLLAVTDRFGLRNQRIQSGPPGRPKAVPTSILADAGGTIRWIDPSESYQRRSSPERVLAAVREHLGSEGGVGAATADAARGLTIRQDG